MDAKHTPGPWIAVPNGGDDEDTRALLVGKNDQYGDFTTIADCRARWVPDEIGGDEEANARLIAAAPDLLDVAKRCLAMVSEGAGPPNWDWIREVIAKAEGRPTREQAQES